MDSEKQIKNDKLTRFHGMNRMIALKTGFAEDYVSRVLSGKVNRQGKKARRIIELAERLTTNVESVLVEDNQ